MIRYHARWVLPVGSPPLQHATVAVDADRIAWVGLRDHAPPGTDVELGDAVLMPGLINAHTHLDLSMFAGALTGLSFYPWLRLLVRGLAEATDAMALDDAARWSVADQLAHGVTTIGHTGPGRAPFDALRAFGARGVAYFETFGPDPAQRDASLADLHARVTAARLDESALVRVGVSPHAPYSVSDALYLGVAQYALREALPMAVHIAESHEESQLVTRGAGPFATLLQDRGIDVRPRAASPIALLERTGILAARPLCIHAVQADESDARRLAAAGATVAHCPRANAWFGYGTAPVAEFRAHGVCVGLGTDSLASNTDVRLLSEAAAAADEALLPAARLALATIGGAAALGLESATGSLEAGKQADLAAFSISDIVACDAQPERYVVERCTDSASILTVVAGAVRARNGRATALTPSDDALPARVAAHRLRAEAWAGERRAHDPRFKA